MPSNLSIRKKRLPLKRSCKKTAPIILPSAVSAKHQEGLDQTTQDRALDDIIQHRALNCGEIVHGNIKSIIGQ
jgi:hypothetical protein